MAEKNYLAMDFGASTGRGIAGSFDGSRLKMEEIHRFANYYVPVHGKCYWDIFRLVHEILESFSKAGGRVGSGNLVSVGIDTWGTDYGLVDKNGQIIGNPRCMRNADGTYVELIRNQVTPEELFRRTGIQTIFGNTLFQMFERLVCEDPALKEAAHFLMLPDLMAYILTGEMYHEYTMASTSMMYSHEKKDWDRELLHSIGLPDDIYSPILLPASAHFPVADEILAETGLEKLNYVPVGTHDTASAVAAAPLGKNEVFCSSGTWSLVGTEVSGPVISEAVYRANFSNEGTVDGGVRLLKNIMGMWILQQMARELQRGGVCLSWDEIVAQAAQAEAFRSFIDVEQPQFYQAGNMTGKIRDYCRQTGQPVPQSVGELARCVYESLAMQYRMTFHELEKLLGRKLEAFRIVGGGCQNRLLNQFAANAINRPVYTGPVECACAGNLLVQAMEDGEIGSFAEIRDVVRRSFETETYEPRDTDLWDAGYEKYRKATAKEETKYENAD